MRMNRTALRTVYLLSFLLICFNIGVVAQKGDDLTRLAARVKADRLDTSLISQLWRQGEYYAAKNNAGPREGDSLLMVAEYIRTISERHQYQRGRGLYLLMQAKGKRFSGKAAEGKVEAKSALEMLSTNGRPLEYASALIEWGGTFSNSTADLPEKIRFYSSAANIYHQQHHVLEEARILEFVADLYHIQRQYEQSIKLLNEALRLYKSINHSRIQGVYALMGAVYAESEEFLKALRYNQLAVSTAEELGDTTTTLMTAIYNRLGMNYFDIRSLHQAMGYYLKGLRSARNTNDSPAIRNLLLNIAQCDQFLGNYQQALDTLQVADKIHTMMDLPDTIFSNMLSMRIHLLMDDVNRASPYYKNLLMFYHQRMISGVQKQMIRVALAQYLQACGRFGASYPYLDAFREDRERYGSTINRTLIYELCASRADSATGNMSGALSHYQRYKTLSDSLAALTTGRQIGQLQMAFETEKKDKDILLLQRMNSIQQESLHRERTIRSVIIGAVILLFAFCLVLYKAYGMKKDSNRKLESQQVQLKKLLDEKEWLLKEIHHRVKNNLQMVISLLNSQSAFLDNDAAITAIRNSQHRMYAMSLIHQKLYQTEGLSTINMQWYVRELVNYMEDCFDTSGKIHFNLAVISAEFDVAQAVPVGLILNEIVSNAIKYAFPGGRGGNIVISLEQEENEYILKVADNGIGLPADYDISTSQSLGMSLIYGLSQQLDGVLEVRNNKGLCFDLRFAADCQFYTNPDLSTDPAGVSVRHSQVV